MVIEVKLPNEKLLNNFLETLTHDELIRFFGKLVSMLPARDRQLIDDHFVKEIKQLINNGG